jgi:hypothetical protein
MTLPRWIPVGKNPHGGLVHQGPDGFWRASTWEGCHGGYATEAEAEFVVLTAPPEPKRKRQAKQEPPDVMKDWKGLTDSASGFVVRDGNGRGIGGVKPSGDRFAAWVRGEPIGEFDGPGPARAAVFVAHRARKKGRP